MNREQFNNDPILNYTREETTPKKEEKTPQKQLAIYTTQENINQYKLAYLKHNTNPKLSFNKWLHHHLHQTITNLDNQNN